MTDPVTLFALAAQHLTTVRWVATLLIDVAAAYTTGCLTWGVCRAVWGWRWRVVRREARRRINARKRNAEFAQREAVASKDGKAADLEAAPGSDTWLREMYPDAPAWEDAK